MRPRCLALAVGGACSLAACHLLLPYESRDDASAAPGDRGGDAPHDRAVGERWLVLLDGPAGDAAGDGRPRIPDAGVACEAQVALWTATCQQTHLENSCGIGCGPYTVVCVARACDCAREAGGSHRCTGITSSTADCGATSACFEAVATGCCVGL